MPQSARIEQITREGVISLNKIWDDEGWTNAGIVEEMRKHNEATSESTVQKMRKPGAENNSYNYNNTIKPMLRVFARISEEPVSVSKATTPQEVQIATLNNTILMREADIKVLTAKLAAAEEKIIENSAAEQRKLAHLQEQIKDMTKLLEDRKGFMGERRDFILRLEQEKKDLKEEFAREKETLQRQNVTKSVLLVLAFIVMLVAFGTDAIIPLF